MRRPFATLLLLSLLTFVVGLGRQAITDGDEAYYAEAAREMVESGDWLTPHFNYQDRWQKPILYYWVTAAAFTVTGSTEWSARAFAGFSGVALALLTYLIGRRMFASDVAWIGGAIVATCYGYFALARLALPDLPLALFTTLGIALWLERRPMLAGLATALGVLDKGPVALVIPALVLLPLAYRERRWPESDAPAPVSLAPRDLAVAFAAFLLVATPWYAGMVLEHGTAYLQSFFIGDNLERFATDRFNAPRAVWFYVPILMGGVFPWTAYLLVLPWRRMAAVVRRRTVPTWSEWRLLTWAAVPFLFFTVSVGKQPRYILPLLPPLALLLASSISTHITEARSGQTARTRALRIATYLTAALYAVAAVLLVRAQPIFITALPGLTIGGSVALGACATWLAWTAWNGAWSQVPTRMAVTAAIVLLVMQFGALAGRRPEAVETVAAALRAERATGERVLVYRTLVRNLVFYSGTPVVEVFNDRQALDLLASQERLLIVGRAEDVLRLQGLSKLPFRAIASARYVDPATIRLATILSPLPRQDVATIMVAASR